MSTSKMLNIGCGRTYHLDWVNLDVATADPNVLAVNINDGLPFPEESVSVCYSSHVLEHLDKVGARNLIAECFRVLQRGGVIRLAVPDLETLAREYLHVLEAVSAGDISREEDYDWLMLELYDQTVRTSPGGEMKNFLFSLPESKRDFVRFRIGGEAEQIWSPKKGNPKRSKLSFSKLFKRLRENFASFFVYLIAGKAAAQSFRIGLFRNSGEVHQWMYDRYSLTRLLNQVGFVNARVCGASESSIVDYEKYSLDIMHGKSRKPDSLYVEAFKP